MSGTKELFRKYSLRKGEIRQRLEAFRELRNAPDRTLFYELCFCITTANGSATAGSQAQACLERNRAWETGNFDDCLISVRYGDAKAAYIRHNRENILRDKLSLKDSLEGDPYQVRERIVKDKQHFKGLGYKEASHFLRNVGRGGNLSILDRHILAELCELKVIPSVPESLGRKKYLEIEQRMQEFSQKVGIPMDELDLLFWSMRTGFILK